jgi:L-threonylcarbamoyladenylate synthase
MNTQILTDSNLSLAIEALKKGEPVVFPTETVYGLGAPLFDEQAILQIFKLKGRPLDNPLIAHISSLEEVSRLSDALDSSFYRLAERFWPGPLTIVVKRKETVPSLASAGQPTIAIRMPSHPIARKLIEGVGAPLVAPSANLSGKPSPTRVADVLEDFEGQIKYVIDGGTCEVGIESTVISLFHQTPTLLRPGLIKKAELEEVLKQTIDLPSASGPILSPGMKYRHYAPKASLKLVFRKKDIRGPFIQPTAQSFYAQLREADRLGLAEIQIYCDANLQKDEGLMNRLLRAAGQIV